MIFDNRFAVAVRPLVIRGKKLKGWKRGDVGTVVHIHRDGEAYEVEFARLDVHTAAAVTLGVAQVRALNRREITHARELASTGVD